MKKLLRNCLFVILGISVLSFLNNCGRSGEASGKLESVPQVQVVHLKTQEIVRYITLPGSVRAYQEAALYAKVAGYLKSIKVDKGDRVNAGDTLAEIEAPEMLADWVKFKAEAEAARAEYERISEAQKKAPDLVTPQSVDAQKAQYETAQANLQRVETLIGYSKIVAPFSGVITDRWVDPGAFIPAATSSSAAKNAAVLRLMNFDKVRITVAIPEAEALLCKKGLSVSVWNEEMSGRKYQGKITRVAYALDDATKTMTAEIEMPNPDLTLRPGMLANVKMALERKPGGLAVPAEALVTEKNQTYVFAIHDGKAVRTSVKTGFDDGISVEIVQGLRPGDAVILAGKQNVSDGQAVHVLETK